MNTHRLRFLREVFGVLWLDPHMGHARLDGRKLALTGSEDVFLDGHRIRLG